jgi:dTDP-4-dehydrorhamnose 3,5-epimerase
MTLEPSTEIIYKCSDFYTPPTEGVLRWGDPAIGIDWPRSGVTPVISDKDAAAPCLNEFNSPFNQESSA